MDEVQEMFYAARTVVLRGYGEDTVSMRFAQRLHKRRRRIFILSNGALHQFSTTSLEGPLPDKYLGKVTFLQLDV